MNKFCNRLSINIFLLINEYNIYIDKPQIIVDLKSVNPDISNFLSRIGITISHAEIFRKLPNTVGMIHTDLDGLSNHTKINWIIGGKDSQMNWFDPLDSAIEIKSLTSVNTRYTRYNTLKDVKLVYNSKTIQGYPYLIETAVPHQVINPIETRYAICCVLSDLNKKRISMQHAQSLLSDYILDKN